MPEPASSVERYCLALITDSTEPFAEIRKNVGSEFRTFVATTEHEIKAVLELSELHAVLFNLDCIGDGPIDGLEVLEEIRKLREDVVLVAFTKTNSRSLPWKASQAGVDEFFLFPINYDELKIVLLRAIEKRALELEGRRVIQQVERGTAFCGLIGSSPAMEKVQQAIEAVARTGASVVLRGESGVGKELIANAIVQCSERADKPFVALNCSALPESLMESELFGYEKGAFTGADGAKPGLFEVAHTGTVFLDEITTLHPSLQSKLLRVLQERAVQRLGGRSAKKIDFRLLSATNDDLEDCVRKGRFREDLYFRINVVPIFVPPLRERDGDIAILADHFLRIYCASSKKPLKSLHPDVLSIFEDYSWPGNVRELENIVQRLVVMVNAAEITPEHLPQHMLQHSAASQEAILIPESGVDFDAEMQKIEMAYLTAALRRTSGRKTAAAALLHVDPQRMKYLCRKYQIE
ncbi:MAG TPA: sigma-54 dependent transcriptional regulator [Candidatus Sulfotelmatobacter sp.]|nr:sigma-54 dependent transcriptional regulator [Candidatus Sulfotelmatobacter sp.]